MLGDDADAHEVVQDVFVNLLQKPEQYAGKSSMATYLYSAVTHACLNRIRNHRRRRQLAARAPLSPTDLAPLDAERQVLLRSALSELPEPLAQLAIYYYMDELTHEEISQIMGCSRRHVGKLLQRLSAHPASRELSACS